MKLTRLTVFLTMALFLPACTGEADAAGNVSGIADQLTKVLTGITDSATAETAKDQVTSLTDKLVAGFESFKSAAAGAADTAKNTLGEGLGGEAGKTLQGAAAAALPEGLKTAFAGVSKQVERLLGNTEIKAVLGTSLEKLKGVVGG